MSLLTKWVLILYVVNGYGAPMKRPTQVEIGGRDACETAAKVATSDPKHGFSVAICLDTNIPLTNGTTPQ